MTADSSVSPEQLAAELRARSATLASTTNSLMGALPFGLASSWPALYVRNSVDTWIAEIGKLIMDLQYVYAAWRDQERWVEIRHITQQIAGQLNPHAVDADAAKIGKAQVLRWRGVAADEYRSQIPRQMHAAERISYMATVTHPLLSAFAGDVKNYAQATFSVIAAVTAMIMAAIVAMVSAPVTVVVGWSIIIGLLMSFTGAMLYLKSARTDYLKHLAINTKVLNDLYMEKNGFLPGDRWPNPCGQQGWPYVDPKEPNRIKRRESDTPNPAIEGKGAEGKGGAE